MDLLDYGAMWSFNLKRVISNLEVIFTIQIHDLPKFSHKLLNEIEQNIIINFFILFSNKNGAVAILDTFHRISGRDKSSYGYSNILFLGLSSITPIR